MEECQKSINEQLLFEQASKIINHFGVVGIVTENDLIETALKILNAHVD